MKHLVIDRNITYCIQCYWWDKETIEGKIHTFCIHPVWSETYKKDPELADEFTIPDWCPLYEVT